MDVKWRHVWIVKVTGRKSPWSINWHDDHGAPRRLFYRSRDIAGTAKDVKERELNGWLKRQTVRTWAQLLIEYGMHMAGRSPGHQQKVTRLLDRFTLLERPTQSNLITAAMCSHFMAAREQGLPADPPEKPSSATRRTERMNLITFFGWCVTRGYMAENPMASTAAPALPRRIPRPPSPGKWARLLEPLLLEPPPVDDPQGWHVLILMGALTGFRKSILLNCYYGVDVTNTAGIRKLEARHPYGYSIVDTRAAADVGILFAYTGKTRRESLVGIPPLAAGRIRQRISDLEEPAGRLFRWVNWQKKAWARILAAAGLADVTFHALRGASGTQAAVAKAEQAGADLLEHSSSRVTHDHYLDQEAVARVVALGRQLPADLPALPRYKIWSDFLAKGGRPPRGSGSIDPLG